MPLLGNNIELATAKRALNKMKRKLRKHRRKGLRLAAAIDSTMSAKPSSLDNATCAAIAYNADNLGFHSDRLVQLTDDIENMELTIAHLLAVPEADEPFEDDDAQDVAIEEFIHELDSLHNLLLTHDGDALLDHSMEHVNVVAERMIIINSLWANYQAEWSKS